jgi:hypothetical protein
MYITENIRDEYSGHFEKLLPVPSARKTSGNRNAEAISNAYRKVNSYLQDHIESIATTRASDIRDPTFLHKVIGIPPHKIKDNMVRSTL